MLGAFALRDPIRPMVKSAVGYARDQGQMNIRLISGDHIETATAAAMKAGILSSSERGQEYAVMHADDFENKVGKNGEDQVNDIQTFSNIMKELKVIARAKPYRKHMIVHGLKQIGKNVCVTGDGINDVKAILAADVGLAMGSGCSAAKETADMILIGDDFEATIKAVMWGRNIFHNVARFL